MAKTDFKTIDEYIATFPSEVQVILQTVRSAIHEAVPDAEEVISYQIPAIKQGGEWILYFSAFKNHYSLSCPPQYAVFQAFERELAPYKLSKSTIQLPLDKPVPVQLIKDMAAYRARQIAEKSK